MSAQPLTLAAGTLELRLRADRGGSIERFDWLAGGERFPIMRGADAPARVLDCACFPLVPYSNRIRGGRFDFRGRTIVQVPNMAGDASPLHGQGWLAAWHVAQVSECHAELTYRHEAGEWPWAYEARQQFALDPGGLDLTLSCRNLSPGPMPCGLGLHPYFPCTSATRLDTRVTGTWTIDEDVLPVDLVPADGRYSLSDRAICAQDLDNGFEGWGGEARIATPGAPFVIRMTSSDATRFQVYSPAAGGLFVAEPVQAANAALNAPEEDWHRLGLRVLAPGEATTLTTRFDIVPA